jgi:hypothetical protein
MQVILKDGKKEEVIFEFSETDKKIVENDVLSFEDWLKAGPLNIMREKVLACEKRLHEAHLPKLAEKFSSIPTNKTALSELILSQPDYKSRATLVSEEAARKSEEKAKREAIESSVK